MWFVFESPPPHCTPRQFKFTVPQHSRRQTKAHRVLVAVMTKTDDLAAMDSIRTRSCRNVNKKEAHFVHARRGPRLNCFLKTHHVMVLWMMVTRWPNGLLMNMHATSARVDGRGVGICCSPSKQVPGMRIQKPQTASTLPNGVHAATVGRFQGVLCCN